MSALRLARTLARLARLPFRRVARPTPCVILRTHSVEIFNGFVGTKIEFSKLPEAIATQTRFPFGRPLWCASHGGDREREGTLAAVQRRPCAIAFGAAFQFARQMNLGFFGDESFLGRDVATLLIAEVRKLAGEIRVAVVDEALVPERIAATPLFSSEFRLARREMISFSERNGAGAWLRPAPYLRPAFPKRFAAYVYAQAIRALHDEMSLAGRTRHTAIHRRADGLDVFVNPLLRAADCLDRSGRREPTAEVAWFMPLENIRADCGSMRAPLAA